jgi:hypothetical protein
MDSGRAGKDYKESTLNNINSKAIYAYATVRQVVCVATLRACATPYVAMRDIHFAPLCVHVVHGHPLCPLAPLCVGYLWAQAH